MKQNDASSDRWKIHRRVFQVGSIFLILISFLMITAPIMMPDQPFLPSMLGRAIPPGLQRSLLIVLGCLHLLEGVLLFTFHRGGWFIGLGTAGLGVINGLVSGPHWIPVLTALFVILYLFYTRPLFLGDRRAAGAGREGTS